MMRTLGWLLLLSLVFFPSALCAQTEDADAPTEAQTQAAEHFKRGVDLFRDGDYRAALVEFERADSIAPSYHVQFNMGQVAYALKDYARALKSYRRFLDEGGDATPPEKRAQAEAAIEKLRVRVGEVFVVTNITRGEVLIDDTKVVDLPSGAAILVSAGRRKVSVLEPGHAALTRFVDVAGGDEVSVEIMSAATAKAEAGPMPEASVPQTEVAEPVASEQRRGLPVGFWVSASIAAGLAAGAGTMGILTMTAKSEYDSKLKTVVKDRGALDDDWKTVEERALVTDILMGASVAAAAVTVVIVVTSKGREKERPVASLFVSPQSAGLLGSF
jgi:hypothetical protein